MKINLKSKKTWIALALLLVAVGLYWLGSRYLGTDLGLFRSAETEQTAESAKGTAAGTPGDTPTVYTLAVLNTLKNTDNFAKNTLTHIFDGNVNAKGNGSGYHYAMISDSKGKIVEGTRSEPDKNGVYTADVEVDGHTKLNFSSFFPDNWTPQQVVDAINAAYAGRKSGKNDIWIGYYGDIEINMYLDDNGKITSAYPIYQGD